MTAEAQRDDRPGAIHGLPDNGVRSATARDHDFVVALESVRGLAALAVLVFHAAAFLGLDDRSALYRTWSELRTVDELLRRLVGLVFNGHVAVSLFFVLSGFVLALSLRRDHRAVACRAGAFVGRRVFRIYPALAVNVVLTVAIVAGLAAALPAVGFGSHTWRQLGDNLLLYGFAVNGASWTLLIEILAIPLLLIGHLLTARHGSGALLLLAVLTVLVMFSPGLARALVPGDDPFRFFVRTFIIDYQFMFVFGMLVAELPNRFQSHLRAANAATIAALIAMLSARFLFGYSSRWSLLIEGAAAAALVGLLAHGPRSAAHQMLERWPLRSLGRVSYSFYLYHATALAMVIPVVSYAMTGSGVRAHPYLASLAVAAAATIVTIPLAWASYRFIERPMMRLGRRL